MTQHLAWVGRAGWKDWTVARYAAQGDFVLVTNNAGDFRKIYATTELHPGLIIVVPNVGRHLQCRLFRAALDAPTTPGDLISRVLEVGIEGEDATLELYDLPR